MMSIDSKFEHVLIEHYTKATLKRLVAHRFVAALYCVHIYVDITWIVLVCLLMYCNKLFPISLNSIPPPPWLRVTLKD